MNRDKYIEQTKIEWVTMNMRLSGSAMDREKAVKIAGGEYVLDATLEEHLMVCGLLDVLSRMEALLDMQEELSPRTLDKLYQALTGGNLPEYRKTTPILFHLSYNPVLPQEIGQELSRLFRYLHRDRQEDMIERAVRVHNEIIRIYPYDSYSEVIARAAMEYELCYSGLKVYPLTVSEAEYNHALAAYLKTGRENILAQNLKLNRLMAESRG